MLFLTASEQCQSKEGKSVAEVTTSKMSGYECMNNVPNESVLQCHTAQCIFYINDRRLSVTEVRALYGPLSCGWLGVVCAWRHTLR